MHIVHSVCLRGYMAIMDLHFTTAGFVSSFCLTMISTKPDSGVSELLRPVSHQYYYKMGLVS